MKTVDLYRVDFALIPDDPLFRAAIDASQAITDMFYYNGNIIDDKTFPPHVSLHICTVPRDAVPQVVDRLRTLVVGDLPELVPIGVEQADGGYVMLNIERTDALLTLHEAILSIAAGAQECIGHDKHGSPYVRALFTPHISLAKVEYREQAEAVAIGRETLSELSIVRARTLDLCDIANGASGGKSLRASPDRENGPRFERPVARHIIGQHIGWHPAKATQCPADHGHHRRQRLSRIGSTTRNRHHTSHAQTAASPPGHPTLQSVRWSWATVQSGSAYRSDASGCRGEFDGGRFGAVNLDDAAGAGSEERARSLGTRLRCRQLAEASDDYFHYQSR